MGRDGNNEGSTKGVVGGRSMTRSVTGAGSSVTWTLGRNGERGGFSRGSSGKSEENLTSDCEGEKSSNCGEIFLFKFKETSETSTKKIEGETMTGSGSGTWSGCCFRGARLVSGLKEVDLPGAEDLARSVSNWERSWGLLRQ